VNKSKRKQKRGFTLIELLVVVAIIAILASIVLANLETSRKKTRDSRRKSDIKQIQVALELYSNDNGDYASTGGAWWGNCSDYGSHPTSGINGWIPNLAPTYISELPLDPEPVGNDGCYLYNSDGKDYKLLAHKTMDTEGCPPMPSNESMYDPIRSSTQCTIGIFTLGATNW
jgi:prepilin-type N-terminal cleavage/methylation domain-containing protein